MFSLILHHLYYLDNFLVKYFEVVQFPFLSHWNEATITCLLVTWEICTNYLFSEIASHCIKSFHFDPQGRPTVTAGSDHCFCTYCPSVRPHFSKQNKFLATMLDTGETVCLAEWIIDDTVLSCIELNLPCLMLIQVLGCYFIAPYLEQGHHGE